MDDINKQLRNALDNAFGSAQVLDQNSEQNYQKHKVIIKPLYQQMKTNPKRRKRLRKNGVKNTKKV